MPNKMTPEEIQQKLGCILKPSDIITIKNAYLLWPNFAGEPDQYNSKGDRNFNVRLEEDVAEEFAKQGWNVKCKPARPNDPDAGERCVLKVTVNFDSHKPPKIKMIGSSTRNRTVIHAGIAGLVDAAEIVECDLTIVPYFWHIPATDAIGVTAYLRSMYVVVSEDELDEKWAEDEPQDDD